MSVDGRLGTSEIQLVCLADVKPERTEWLWPGRIPFGAVTILDGEPNLGKSTILADLGARVSTGAAMPHETEGRVPAGVVLLTAEDHLAATVRPRLDAAGADTQRIFCLLAVPRPNDPSAPPTLAPEDVAQIEAAIKERNARLVIVDPLTAFLPSGVNPNHDHEVRRVLGPLVAMAQRTGVAVVIVRHLRKGEGSAMNRGAGSIAISAAARSVLLVGRDSNGSDWRLLASTKGNLARTPATIRYRLVDTGDVARIEWGDTSDVTADELASLPVAVPDRKVDAVKAEIRRQLADGPRPSTDVEKAVKEAVDGCSDSTIRRGREALKVIVQSERGEDGRTSRWLWRLPDAHAPADEQLAGPRVVTDEPCSENIGCSR